MIDPGASFITVIVFQLKSLRMPFGRIFAFPKLSRG